MKQQVAIITLGIRDLEHSKKFYIDGFGWNTIFEDNETAMYQMNGFILSTWLQSELEKDVGKYNLHRGGAITLAYLVDSGEKVKECLDQLLNYGGKIIRHSEAPLHGGMRGYISDPDEHIWEIIYNPVWKVDHKGMVTFSSKQ